jgi:hypothetical protein
MNEHMTHETQRNKEREKEDRNIAQYMHKHTPPNTSFPNAICVAVKSCGIASHRIASHH